MRLILILGLVCLGYLTAQGQCRVSEDDRGQVTTTCDVYSASGVYSQVKYLGSQYMTFPTWLRGVIQVDTSGKVIACELAYDLTKNEVMCRFNGDAKINYLIPYSFTINGVTFVRQINNLLGIDYQLYSTILHDGQTKLLKSLTNILIVSGNLNGYEKKNEFDGIYQTKEKYYIRKGEAQPELIELTKASLVNTLYEQSEKIAPILLNNNLTVTDVIVTLQHYDSLVTQSKINKQPLSFDPVFNQYLHDQIIYPSQAWLGNIYGRVYVGFDVDKSGFIKDIVTISPENSGFGFDQAVKQGLGKVFRVRPDYAGRYILPVAFTFANSKEKGEVHVPINVLPADRFGDRSILEEFVVPVKISKPVGNTREVWGYYK